MQDAFSGLDPSIPLLCVCGNHDVGNAPTAVTVQRYVSEFGDDYFGFWVGGVRGIVINSNLYYDPSKVGGRRGWQMGKARPERGLIDPG